MSHLSRRVRLLYEIDNWINVLRPEFPQDLTPEAAGPADHLRHERPAPESAFDDTENSQNWSGAYITPIPRPNRFVQIVGGWTVPRPRVPTILPEGVDPANQEYHSSTWIGIGGHRSYNSLPQIGTSQIVKVVSGVATVEYSAWWQWWVRDDALSHVPQEIPGFDVRDGDDILASISVEAPSSGDVHFIIMNLRTGVVVPFKVMARAGIRPLGSTAEWIHERRLGLQAGTDTHCRIAPRWPSGIVSLGTRPVSGHPPSCKCSGGTSVSSG